MQFTEKILLKKQFDLHCTIGLSQTNLHPSVFVEQKKTVCLCLKEVIKR